MMKLLAAGVPVKTPGYMARRIVLRAEVDDEGKPEKFVVHLEITDEKGRISHCTGHYFVPGVEGRTSTSAAVIMAALLKAQERFFERCRKLLDEETSYDEVFCSRQASAQGR